MSDRSQGRTCHLRSRIALSCLLQMCLSWTALASLEVVIASQGSSSKVSQKTSWEYIGLDLEIELQPERGRMELSGVARLRLLENSASGPVLYINAEERNLQFTRVTAVRAARQTALDVELAWVDTCHVAQVAVDRPFRAGDEVTVEFAVETVASQAESLVARRVMVGLSFLPWYPFLDTTTPEDTVLTVPRTIGRTILHLPPGWTAIVSGALQERSETADEVQETWVTSRPAPRSFCAGKFNKVRQVVEGRGVDVYLLDARPQDIVDPLSMIGNAINVLESRLGSLGDTLWTVVEVPNEFGHHWLALAENDYILTRSATLIHAGGNLPFFAHELAHAWWGEYVRPARMEDLFCSEALSQYFAAVAIEDVLGERQATEFLRWSSMGFSAYASARGYFALVAQDLDMPLSSAPPRDLLYSKGPWVLRMLRDLVGDVVFFETLRSILRTHAHGTLTLEEFRDHFIESSPDPAAIQAFFEQWLDQVGAPTLMMKWRAQRDSTDGITIFLEQSYVHAPFHFDLDIGIVADGGIVVHRVPVHEMLTRFELECTGTPSMVILDPRHRLLLWSPEYGIRHKMW